MNNANVSAKIVDANAAGAIAGSNAFFLLSIFHS
jgi:hypothetical protein